MGTTEQFDHEIPVQPMLWIGALIVALMLGSIITMDWYLEGLRGGAVNEAIEEPVPQDDLSEPALLANPEAHLRTYRQSVEETEDMDRAMDSLLASQASLEAASVATEEVADSEVEPGE